MPDVRRTGVTLVLLLALSSLPRTQDTAQPREGGTAQPREAGTAPSRLRTIAIDPGHGGDDAGVRGAGGLEERQLTLDVALRLRTRLETQLKVRVVLTREDDRTVGPDDRAAIANEARADLLLSLHANAAPAVSVSGAEVYYSALDPAHAELLPSAQAPPTLLQWDEAQARQYDASERLAGIVHEELQRAVPMNRRSLRRAPLRVLQGAAMPAVLVEMLFLTNPDQEGAASASELRDTLAAALVEATARFQTLMDSRIAP
jgi:N-acetylmuramoyl-L-alanine amidase